MASSFELRPTDQGEEPRPSTLHQQYMDAISGNPPTASEPVVKVASQANAARPDWKGCLAEGVVGGALWGGAGFIAGPEAAAGLGAFMGVGTFLYCMSGKDSPSSAANSSAVNAFIILNYGR